MAALAELRDLLRDPGVLQVVEGARSHPTTEPAKRLLFVYRLAQLALGEEDGKP